MGKRRAASSAQKKEDAYEASIRRAVSMYFRAAQLGSPTYFLDVLRLNRMFILPHDALYFGWIAFGQIRTYVRRFHAIPPYLDHFAPYLADAAFFISKYIKSLSASGRESYRAVICRINKVMRQQIFPESILYGVEPSKLTAAIKHAHKMALSKRKTPDLPQVPGLCLKGKPHGVIVEGLHGAVCTVCGRVGERTFKQHFNDRVVSEAKLAVTSLATGRHLPDGAMCTLIRVTDSSRTMSRGQFISWTERPFYIPYADGGAKCGEYHLPPPYRKWLLFLYDFVKDWAVDRSGREDRINVNWAQAIWIYGYLVWITVQRAKVTSAETQIDMLAANDRTQTAIYRNPQICRYRFLEAFYDSARVRYYRVQGSSYRFYPPTFKPPQFEVDLKCADKSVFADANVRTLARWQTAAQTHRKKIRAKFWDGRYIATLCSNAGSVTIQVRAAPTSNEMYLHLLVPKDAKINLIHFKYAGFTLDVQTWEDPELHARYPLAKHYFVHITTLRGPTVRAQFWYQTNGGKPQSTTISGIMPTMEKCLLKLGTIKAVARPARLTLCPVVKDWVQASMPT